MNLPGAGTDFAVEVHADRAAWLAARAGGIGGSDAPSLWSAEIAAQGGRTFGSPYSVWCEKRGLLQPEAEAEHLEIGARVEPVIADLYAARTGARLVYPGPHVLLRSLRWPALTVSLDRAIDHALDPGVLECKWRAFDAARWREGLPVEVQVQLAHALLVTGWTWGAGAALAGGSFYAHRYERDDGFLEAHLGRCLDMARRITEDDPPPVDGHAATSEALRWRFASDAGLTIEAGPQLAADAEARERLLSERAAVQEQLDAADNRIRAAMGGATWARLPDGRRLQLRAAAGHETRAIRVVKGASE